MNKTFFDLNSKNTFNKLECYIFNTPKYDPKNKELYWVTKTFYSIQPETKISDYWRLIVSRMRDLDIYSPILKIQLNCGHIGIVSQAKLSNCSNSMLEKMRVSCQDCGGTGEIKINE